nr:AAA family ATPase [Paracoccus aerius]
MKLVEEIRVENFKSIEKLNLPLGRVNVFIGENGAGKSNILEAVAFAAAAAAEKIDNEFLSARGIRVSRPDLMRSAFDKYNSDKDIKFSLTLNSHEGVKNEYDFSISSDDRPYASWKISEIDESSNVLSFSEIDLNKFESLLRVAFGINEEDSNISDVEKRNLRVIQAMVNSINSKKSTFEKNKSGKISIKVDLNDEEEEFYEARKKLAREEFGRFVIFSPENTALRSLQSEGQIVPLGVNGEGLLQFLATLAEKEEEDFTQIKNALSLFTWFSDLKVDSEDAQNPFKLRDRFLDPNFGWMDQRSANEGFLFAAFYFSLFTSKLTPRFFAIDNIDASLNPKLCQELMVSINKLSKINNKQAILTTHNPAILDGLDLTDPEQKLFVVSRDRKGKTRVRSFDKPEAVETTRLSELYIRGLLGGLPKGF